MVSFGKQIRLLLWKNFLIRRRQKIWLAIEIIAPIVLFAILVLIRTKKFTTAFPLCHYDAKASPSAGLMPFFQSLLCSFPNQCRKAPTTADNRGLINQTDTQSPLIGAVRSVSKAFLGSPESYELLFEIVDLASEIIRALANLPPAQDDGVVPLRTLLNQPDRFYAALYTAGADNKSLEMLKTASVTPYFLGVAADQLIRANALGTIQSAADLDELPNVFGDFMDAVFCDETTLNRSLIVSDYSALASLCSENYHLDSVLSSDILLLELRKLDVEIFNTAGIMQAGMKLTTNVTGRAVTTDALPLAQIFALLERVQNDEAAFAPFAEAWRGLVSVRDAFVENDEDTLLSRITCGSMDATQDAITSGQSRSQYSKRIQDLLQQIREGGGGQGAEKKNLTCGGIFVNRTEDSCTRDLDLGFMARLPQVSLLVRGYILVSPDAPVVRELVRRLENAMENAFSIQTVLTNLDTTAPAAVKALYKSDIIKALKVLINMTENFNQTFPGLENVQNMTLEIASWRPYLYNETMAEEEVLKVVKQLKPVTKFLKCIRMDRFRIFENETAMEQAGTCLKGADLYYSGLTFVNFTANLTELPQLTAYKIRMAHELVDGITQIHDSFSNVRPRNQPLTDLKYLTFGFSFIQDAVDRAIIAMQTGTDVSAGVYSQQEPHACTLQDDFLAVVPRFVPLFVVIAWIMPVALLVKNVVYEKEMRLKEVMKVMGLGDSVHWLAWALQAFLLQMISVLAITLLCKFGGILPLSDPSLLFAFLLLFGLSNICMCILLSVFFSSANAATAVTVVMYWVLRFPYALGRRYITTVWTISLASLATPSAVGWGVTEFSEWEYRLEGMQWRNLFVPGNYYSGVYPLGYVMIMLLLDSFLYLLFAWYIQNVFPGSYGIGKPWYFPIQASFWCGETAIDRPMTAAPIETGMGPNQSDFEPLPKHLTQGVQIQNLRKVYANGTRAVDNLSLNFYESQITAFLGHNGAGKTTTLSILTGLFPPSSGTAWIYDRDIRTEMDTIRHSLGMCPQHNVLFDNLTVEEQLTFYAALKNVRQCDLKSEVRKMIKDVGLEKKTDAMSNDLSGGMQRKLSIAVAFIGGSKTVILDEPTAGVDPHARRAIWDLLLKNKLGRTIILSTHHMDEADVLGDRIAIISGGRLRTCGTALFLKNRFGSGYRLTTVVKRGDSTPSPRSTPLPPVQGVNNRQLAPINGAAAVGVDSVVTTFVTQRVPGSRFVERVGDELVFALPRDDAADTLQRFFADLDRQKQALGVTVYGISDTTLEEIFLKVAPKSDEDLQKDHIGCSCMYKLRRAFKRRKPLVTIPADQQIHEEDGQNLVDSGGGGNKSPQKPNDEDDSRHPKVDYIDQSRWAKLAFQRLTALFVKRFHNFKRNLKGAFFELLLPVGLIALATIVISLLGKVRFQDLGPGLVLVPWIYPTNADNKTSGLTYISLENGNTRRNMSSPLGIALWDSLANDPPGIGIRCMAANPYKPELSCLPTNSSSWTGDDNTTGVVPYTVNGSCSCTAEEWNCDKLKPYKPLPAIRLTNTTDILVDMTARNISQWILDTVKQFQFKRYGGFNLGELNLHAPADALLMAIPTNVRTVIKAVDQFLTGVNFNMNDTTPIRSNSTRPSFAANLTLAEVLTTLISNLDVKQNAKVWFNNKGWASLPAFTNTLSNALLRATLEGGIGRAEDYGIITINQPMNYSTEERLSDFRSIQDRGRVQLFQAILTILAFSIVPASFVLFLIDERVSHAKHLQFVTGVPPWLYWTANLLWDMVNFSLPMFLVFVVFWCSNSKAYVGTFESTTAFFSLLMLYGFATIPLMYLFTFVIRIAPLAFVLLGGGAFFLGVVTTMTVAVLRWLVVETPDVDDDIRFALDFTQEAFLVLPQFCLGISLMDMNIEYAQQEVIRGFIAMMGAEGTIDVPSAELFAWEKLGKRMFCLLIEGLIGFSLVLIIEYRQDFCSFKSCRSSKNDSNSDEDVAVIGEDEDVTEERRRVVGSVNKGVINIKNLTKVYGHLKAVDRLTIVIEPGECFGLLGVNGAGKTTTFKMITGKVPMTAGDAEFGGLSVRGDMQRIHQMLGYCPQFDALNGLLTGREQLTFYARIRGVRERDIKKVVDWAIRHMNLSAHAQEPTRGYSGGNRRKLSTALAMIGEPMVVLLDEPSTGMDPNTRRFMWNRILQLRKENRTVVLTSHSMEECEALCTRIGIMVNGRLKCLGSVQHLKDKYGEGYTLTLKLCSHEEAQIEEACRLIEKELPFAKRIDVHSSQVTYKLPSGGRVALSEVFATIQRLRLQVEIEDYAISQTTLDEVFVGFAAKAVEDANKLTDDGKLAADELNGVVHDGSVQGSRRSVSNGSPVIADGPLTDQLDVTVASPIGANSAHPIPDDGPHSLSSSPGSQLNGSPHSRTTPPPMAELMLLTDTGSRRPLTPIDDGARTLTLAKSSKTPADTVVLIDGKAGGAERL